MLAPILSIALVLATLALCWWMPADEYPNSI
jgi:hypothetical protein